MKKIRIFLSPVAFVLIIIPLALIHVIFFWVREQWEIWDAIVRDSGDEITKNK